MLDWFELRRQARRDIHAAFAVSASHSDGATVTNGLHVRWHDRFTSAIGDIGGGEYAKVFENIDRLLFDPTELAEKSLNLKRGDTITLTDYGWVFSLDVMEPLDGPDKISWTVMR